MTLNTSDIRSMFLNFFSQHSHHIMPSSSLIPKNDASLLFTNAGMNQFKNIFLGLEECIYNRIATSQRCLRVGGKHNDLENVGYTAYHHTFFEMLGNFSFGNYFKYDAIQFAWELLTSKDWFNLPSEKLLVTVDSNDDESYDIWAHKIGVPMQRIIQIDRDFKNANISDNFWKMSDTGPCGPCSEIFYEYHQKKTDQHLLFNNIKINEKFIEIWNIVFIQFNRKKNGILVPLSKPSIDTGMGLERMASVLQHVYSIYDIDFFKQLIASIEHIIGTNDTNNISLRIIIDHIRSATFLISDGIQPSNEGRGYILRKIIRRAIRHGNILGIKDIFFYKLVAPLIKIMDSSASQLKNQQSIIENILYTEEKKFLDTLQHGLVILYDIVTKSTSSILDGEIAFSLYDTYGFPLDMTIDVCREHNIRVDITGFERAMKIQKTNARQTNKFQIHHNDYLNMEEKINFIGYETLECSGEIIALLHQGQKVSSIYPKEESIVILNQTPFYGESGGQVGDIGILQISSEVFEVFDTKKYNQVIVHKGILNNGSLKLGDQVIAKVNGIRRKKICLNHSATHLLHAALRYILGNHIQQKGSFINDQRLRFDFSYNSIITSDQIIQIESIINEQIRYNFPIITHILTLDQAKKEGILSLYIEKYQKKIRKVQINNFSTELCGGTHVQYTGDIGIFYIMSIFHISSGIYRIEATTGEVALSYLRQQGNLIEKIHHIIKSDNNTLIGKIISLQQRCLQLEKEIQKVEHEKIIQQANILCHNVRNINGTVILIRQLNNITPKLLKYMVNYLKKILKKAIIILLTTQKDQTNLVIGITLDIISRIKSYDILNYIIQNTGWKGGGRPELAEAGGKKITSLPTLLTNLEIFLTNTL